MRNVPTALSSHLSQDATTVCRLVKMVLSNGDRIAFTTTNDTVTYDDGTDTLAYLPTNGVSPSRIESNATASVDNAEITGWVDGVNITAEQIRGGYFDNAKIIVYLVNYMDPGAGHVLEMSGTAGETIFSKHGWRVEFRSKKQRLRQPLVDAWSLTCRRTYGDSVCGKALSWAHHSVTSVDTVEPDMIFTATSITSTSGTYRNGVVRFTTGDNAGVEVEVETQAAGVITLLLPTPKPIQAGDEFDIRIDCDKLFSTCKNVHNNVSQFDGEPYTPVSDSDANSVPGAQIPTRDSGG